MRLIAYKNNKKAQNNEIPGNNQIPKYQDFLQNLREIANSFGASMRKKIQISCNFYLKRKQIFAQFLHDFRPKNFDWKPILMITGI